MDQTENLQLPFLMPSQAQKHVTHNESLRILDIVAQLAVLDRDLTAPPSTPFAGDRYIVPTGATGAWAGQAGKVAAWQDGGWLFSAARPGWLAWAIDEATLLYWNGSAWQSTVSAITALQNLALLGVGTTADATNPFSAKLNKALWTAKTAGEGGDGDLRYTLNKETGTDVLSLLMQSGFSGRVEMGLIGDDDFSVKISPDGTAWTEAIRIGRTDGKVSLPHTGLRERLTANRTYYVRTDGSDANNGLTNSSGGAFATIQKAVDIAYGAVDLAGFNIIIQVADGTYTGGVELTAAKSGSGSITIQGNASTPGNVVVNYAGSVSGDAAFRARSATVLKIKDMEVRTTGPAGVHGIFARAGYIEFSNIVFGACTGSHVRADTNGVVEAVSGASYAITGSAQKHFDAALGGFIRVQTNTITLTGTPAFSSGFASGIICGCMGINSNTFSGSATGVRYSLASNSVINTNSAGATYLPGSSAGTTASGGQYV